MTDHLLSYASYLDRTPGHPDAATGAGEATPAQREILAALADGWEVLRWRCNDGVHRWHMGEDEVDGRSVRGLWQRGLVEIDMLRHRLPSLVLTRAEHRTQAGEGEDEHA